MATHFVTFEVNLRASAAELHQSIVTELQRWGQPLRWAITAVDPNRQIASIEAVVTTPTELLIPGISVRTV